MEIEPDRYRISLSLLAFFCSLRQEANRDQETRCGSGPIAIESAQCVLLEDQYGHFTAGDCCHILRSDSGKQNSYRSIPRESAATPVLNKRSRIQFRATVTPSQSLFGHKQQMVARPVLIAGVNEPLQFEWLQEGNMTSFAGSRMAQPPVVRGELRDRVRSHRYLELDSSWKTALENYSGWRRYHQLTK